MKYNYLGKELSNDELYQFKDEKWKSKEGWPLFEAYMKNGDTKGFDINKLITDKEYVTTVILPKGKRIIRYGSPTGSFTTDFGTDYDKLGLPYKKESMEYHEYIVLDDLKAQCIVDKGYVAPCFDSPGGAVQYYHHIVINKAIKQNILKEDLSWLKKLK